MTHIILKPELRNSLKTIVIYYLFKSCLKILPSILRTAMFPCKQERLSVRNNLKHIKHIILFYTFISLNYVMHYNFSLIEIVV